MIRIKYLTIMLLLFMFCNNNVNAICSSESLKKYELEAKKIEVNYQYNDDYYINDKKVDGMFNVEIKNIPYGTYAQIEGTNIKFRYEEDNRTIIKGIESGIKKIIIYHDYCNEELRYITLNLPKYNKYSERTECIGVDTEKLDVCDKWYPYELNESTFQSKLKEYNKKQEQIQEEAKEIEKTKTINSIIDFLLKYYIYIIITIILVVLLISIITIKKKRYSLE